MASNDHTDGTPRGQCTSHADAVHDIVQPSGGRSLSLPEASSTRTPTEYRPGRYATASSLSHKHPFESRMPPVSRQRQRSQPHPGPLQNHPSTAPVFPPPPNSYRTPHQGAPPVTLASALTDPSTHPASAPPVSRIVGHQRTLSDVHPRQHVVHSPPFTFPHHIGSPIQEENMHHLAYVSPSTMTALPPHAPVYQYRRPPDFAPTSSYIFPPSVSAPTSPSYPTSPPHSPPTLRHSASSHLGSPHHSTPYAIHGAHTLMGYTTPPSHAYPFPAFVPAPVSHGSRPHYSRHYSFPTGPERRGTWWYSPPSLTVAFNSFDGTQREFQPWATAGYPPVGQLDGEPPGQPNTETQHTRWPANRTPIDRTLNDARQEAAQPGSSPTFFTSARTGHQERRSYHPNPPAHRSEWVMWVGNVPSDVTQDELREFFNQPLPPAESGTSKDRHQVYGGVLTVFIISRSNCAFINFGSEAQLKAAMARFHGQPIRPNESQCPRLVCRVRRKEDDLMAGVGAQRGSGMHINWVKEQRARIQRGQTDKVALPKDLVRSSSPLFVSSDDSGGRGEGHISTHANLSRPASITSTNSDILTRYFPQRYFILKSLTQYDLDLSVQQNIWATQPHNQEILDQAFRTSKDVFLIFSVNKSGEFYGYARMAGPVLRDEIGMPWASATGSTAPPSSGSSLSEASAGPSPSPDVTGAARPDPLYIFTLDGHRVVKQESQSAPATDRPSFAHKPYDRFTSSMPNISTGPPFAVDDPVRASSSKLSSDLFLKNPSARGTRESTGHDVVSGPFLLEHEVSDDVSEVPRDDDGTGSASAPDRPFRIEWIRTVSLPFFRTRALRNPWNHGREVKVSRDGTELEPTVGRQLLDEWDRPSSVAVALGNLPGPSWIPERRGQKSTK